MSPAPAQDSMGYSLGSGYDPQQAYDGSMGYDPSLHQDLSPWMYKNKPLPIDKSMHTNALGSTTYHKTHTQPMIKQANKKIINEIFT